jgi:hypothetical protein
MSVKTAPPLDVKGIAIMAGIVLAGYFLITGISARQLIIGALIIFIVLCYRKYWASTGGMLESFTNLISDLTASSSAETEIMRQVHSKLPATAQLESLKAQYIRELTPYLESMESQEYAVGMLDKVNHYFELMYSNIGLILTDEYYPQSTMVYLLDNQRKLIQQIDDFIFISGGSSQLPPTLQKLRTDAEQVFQTVNLALANFVNSKDTNEMNNITGFLPYPDDPEPYNTYSGLD